ncbi:MULTISPECIES: TRM11 family methyltransferase [unclassified Micromonospora]|uniref:TRM11 family SAM-dependent methyltransferase n=1 Tax=unclassified Micromonospora TaxID=2617518 RepID=UPI001E4E65F8|nr:MULTISPECIES: DNA methyltransferase [unclassified Micromonospora]MDI5937669.1 DNA methyltransferase [Micromonospora sp. DH15]
MASLLAEGYLGSVWLTGQHPSRDLRRGRYTPQSLTHPGKMLPTIPRYAIRTYTNPGEVVLDPMAGIGTTVIEAMRLGRHGVGVEYEAEWVAQAADNIRHTLQAGASGRGEIYHGDSTALPSLLPASLHGRVSLVITSPPYGSSTHGHVRTPGPRRGKVRKINHRYGDGDNLAYRSHHELADGFTAILAGCRQLLRPGGHVVVTARPYRRHGELIDIPGMVAAAGINAGLELVEECIALICGVRDGMIVPRASFFQQKNIRDAIATGDPQWLVQHEDVLILKAPLISESSAEPTYSRRESVLGQPHALGHHSTSPRPVTDDTRRDHRLDAFTPPRVDRRPQPVPPADADGTTAPPAHPGRDAERTSDPCRSYPRPLPRSVRPDATDHRRSADNDRATRQPGPSDAAGRR